MASFLRKTFGFDKAIIAMVHFPPLPGSPLYDDRGGIRPIGDWVQRDLSNLQDGGVDAVMFCNEGDRPYVLDAPPATIATMAYVIGQLKDSIHVPFGVDILWDPKSAIALAKAVGGKFVREIFTGAYESDMGIWDPRCGEIWRYKRLVEANDLKLLYNITGELAGSLSNRSLENVAKSAVLSSMADALCISGVTAGVAPDFTNLELAKKVVPDTPVFANTGVNMKNLANVLSIADGVIIGSGLKVDGNTWNPVDKDRVKEFMKQVNKLR
jgi:membrane complex biogenesis BtpA family protein